MGEVGEPGRDGTDGRLGVPGVQVYIDVSLCSTCSCILLDFTFVNIYSVDAFGSIGTIEHVPTRFNLVICVPMVYMLSW